LSIFKVFKNINIKNPLKMGEKIPWLAKKILEFKVASLNLPKN
jgi:hypothetical protein